MKRIWSLLFLSLFIVLLVACSNDDNSDSTSGDTASDEGQNTTQEGGTIKVGVLASLTGALESYGKQTQRGFELGLEHATNGTTEPQAKKTQPAPKHTKTKPQQPQQKTRRVETTRLIIYTHMTLYYKRSSLTVK